MNNYETKDGKQNLFIETNMNKRGFYYEEDYSGSEYVRNNKNGTETIVTNGNNLVPQDMHSEVWVIVYDLAKREYTHETKYVNLWEVM